MGLLDGDAAAFFGEVFGDVYLPGEITRAAPQYDNKGNQTRPAPSAATCRVQVDAATQAMRDAEGFASTDRALIVLAASIAAPLGVGDTIEALTGPYAGSVWTVAHPITRDPAGAYWQARGVLGVAA